MPDEALVRQTLNDYYATFGSLDLDLIAPFFHEPTAFIGAPGMFPAADRAALRALLAPGIEHLRAEGYARSELDLRQLTMLSATDALAVGVASRYKADGSLLGRMGVTYILHKGDSGWKIAVLVLHDPDYASESTKLR